MFDSGHRVPFIVNRPGLAQGGIHNQALVAHTDIRPTIHDWTGTTAPDDLPGRSWLPILEEPEAPGWDDAYFSHNFHEVIDYGPYRVLHGRRYKYVQNLAYEHRTPLPTDLFRSKTWQAVIEHKADMMGQRPTEQTRRRAPQELYDLETDPVEAVNRIDDPALQEVATQMRDQLYKFRFDTKDVWLEIDFQEGWLDVGSR